MHMLAKGSVQAVGSKETGPTSTADAHAAFAQLYAYVNYASLRSLKQQANPTTDTFFT